MITKQQKLDLYTDLLVELGARGISYLQEDKFQMVIIEDTYKTIEVWKDGFTGGTVTYDYSDNSTSYSNVGCPDFDNVEDAIEWAVN